MPVFGQQRGSSWRVHVHYETMNDSVSLLLRWKCFKNPYLDEAIDTK